MLQIGTGCSIDGLDVILTIVRSVLNFIRVLIPIILIVLGTVDLAKAVMAKDEKATKEAQSSFVRRIVYAVVIFLVPTIINIVFSLLSNIDTYDSSWINCWSPPSKISSSKTGDNGGGNA